MKDLIEELEAHREEEGISKAQMSRLMQANSLQQYNNWVYRKSLPKEWHARAFKILRGAGKDIVLEQEILHKIHKLSSGKAKLVLSLIDEFVDLQDKN